MTTHAYSVTPVIMNGGTVRRYRATCECGTPFGLRDNLDDGGLDGLARGRARQGRKLRRIEIEEEALAKREAAKTKRYGVKSGRR